MNVDYVVDDIPVARMTNRPEKVHESKDKNPVEEMQREKKTLQIDGAEKCTSARHACRMRKGFLYIIECHRHKTKS